ncbi:DUF3098 domain-containing protein [Neptunitalea lumnitzerae]|uniref:DUF3098 domain-containing protein n=1 Tax=Neptunitalea lumnitzerae TaxID=2965509 RepID=A0ABQ5MGL3_9FLAO|nr:DUF3098 domain-containing protein [Neptunitalea sp. Y10]GLB48446.1 hypothetical protein Y10_08140 [Neptunitalea sp. Y10]
MKTNKPDTTSKKQQFVFTKKNYQFMLIGLGVIALGFILMSGGGSDDPNVFNEEMFNTRRIRVAPTVILIGFAIEVFAILYNPDKTKK